MPQSRKLMFVLAHPDDESMGAGGMIAKYTAQGVEVHLVTATRGEYGWQDPVKSFPGPEKLAQIRELELHNAAKVLGVQPVQFLDYIDGYLDQADPQEVIEKIVAQIREVRPQVVVTFGPEGGYGHPDHIAISQLTTAALMCAASDSYQVNSLPPHRVDKLYFMVWPAAKLAAYESAFGVIEFPVDEVIRRSSPWEDWAITTVIDTQEFSEVAWEAIMCHRSQLPLYERLQGLSHEHKVNLYGSQELYRAMSLVNGGRIREYDLFEGVE